jgi:hypothetical protein
MKNESLSIPDIGEMRRELDVFDKPTTGLSSPDDTKGQNGSGAFGEQSLSQIMIWVRRYRRMANPSDSVICFEKVNY